MSLEIHSNKIFICLVIISIDNTDVPFMIEVLAKNKTEAFEKADNNNVQIGNKHYPVIRVLNVVLGPYIQPPISYKNSEF